ncbi:MAG: acetoacetate decarboxylase family protein [Actinomycetota bacterium]
MIYSMDRSELVSLARRELVVKFIGAEMILGLYRTDPEVVRKILPKPLKPHTEPLVFAFVAQYPETNFGLTYNEGGLIVLATYKGELGGYCLSMPVTDDMAMVGGRELVGFPKKIAEEISLTRDGERMTGRVVRKGHEIMNLSCELAEPASLADYTRYVPAVTDLDGKQALNMVSFLFNYTFRPDLMGFYYVPRMIRLVTLFRPREGMMKGPGDIRITSSPYDPLGEVPVRSVELLAHGVWDNDILLGRVAARTWNVARFLPHAFWKTDIFYNMPDGIESFDWGEKLARWRQIRRY